MSNNKSFLALILSILSLCCSAALLAVTLTSAGAARAPSPGEAGDRQKQYIMYVGTNDRDTYKPEHTQEEAHAIVDQVCLKYFEGYTLQEAVGAWADETNTVTHEYTLVCYFDGADRETVYRAADEIIEELNQNTVLIEEDEISVEYYAGKR